MKTKQLLILAGGVMSVLLGLFHCTFWIDPELSWATELTRLTPINANIMQMLDVAVIILLVGLGVILVACRSEIARTRTGSGLLWMLTVFYVVRLAEEFVFPGGTAVWLIAVLAAYVLIYLIPALMRAPENKTTSK